MTFEEMQRSIEAHDRQLDTVVALLASLAERLTALVRVSELQDARLRRLEDTH
jgi:hypothetical protein